MNALRVARAAARVRPSAVCLPLQRRGHADAVTDKIKLTLALPHQVGIGQLRLAFHPIAALAVSHDVLNANDVATIQSIYKSTDVYVAGRLPSLLDSLPSPGTFAKPHVNP